TIFANPGVIGFAIYLSPPAEVIVPFPRLTCTFSRPTLPPDIVIGFSTPMYNTFIFSRKTEAPDGTPTVYFTGLVTGTTVPSGFVYSILTSTTLSPAPLAVVL